MMLTNSLEANLPPVKEKVPDYMIEQCKELEAEAKRLLGIWNKVLTGAVTDVDEKLQGETQQLMDKAEDSAASLDDMISIANKNNTSKAANKN